MSIDQSGLKSISTGADVPLGGSRLVYILFADLCSSTDFKAYCQAASIPDGVWIERQLIFLHRIITVVSRFEGRIVKTIGDEVMAYFPKEVEARQVLRCATDCHSLFRDIARYNNDQWRISSRISIDYGRVYDANFGLVKDDTIDPVGIVVDRCARLNHEAVQNEVAFSSSVFALLPSDLQSRYSKLRHEAELKGIGKAEYYRIAIDNTPPEKGGA